MKLHPVTHNQERRLLGQYLAHLHGFELSTSNFALVLKGNKIDSVALASAVSTIIRRHEALRTTYCLEPSWPTSLRAIRLESTGRTGLFVPGYVRQQVDECHAPALTELDHRSEYIDRQRLVDLVKPLMRVPFDLDVAPLLRAVLVRAADADYAVLIISHIAVDGWAATILRSEFAEAYDAILEGRTPHLPQIVSTPIDFAFHEHRLMRGGHLSSAISYWKHAWTNYEHGALHDSDLTVLGSAGRITRDVQVAAHTVSLTASDSRELITFAASRNITPYAVLRAAFAVVLYHTLRKRQIVFGANFANRPRLYTSLVAWTANTHFLMADMTDDPTAEALCYRQSDTVRNAMRHCALPLPALWHALGAKLDRNTPNITFDVARISNTYERSTRLSPILVPELRDWAYLHVRYAFDNGDVTMTATYNSAAFAVDKIRHLLHTLRNTLLTFLCRPHQPVSRMHDVILDTYNSLRVNNGDAASHHAAHCETF